MGDKTHIEWTDATWNPIRGCSRVSEGCRNCYAERVAARFSKIPNEQFITKPWPPYAGLAEMTTSGPRWTGEVRFIEEHLADPLHWRKPHRIFVNSMSDLFHEKVETEWIDRIFAVMAHCSVEWHRCRARECDHESCNEETLELRKPHIFQVLTKRPERMRKYLSAPDRHERIIEAFDTLGWYFASPPIEHSTWPLPNVWLGVSVEDQKTADERIPLLLQTPAAIRWVSYEPALGPVDFTRIMQELRPRMEGDNHIPIDSLHCIVPKHLDWIVSGGESGPTARPFNIQWARDVIAQCKAAGVPCFVKQLGAFVISDDDHDWIGHKGRVESTGNGLEQRWRIRLNDGKGGDWNEWPSDLKVREYPESRVAETTKAGAPAR